VCCQCNKNNWTRILSGFYKFRMVYWTVYALVFENQLVRRRSTHFLSEMLVPLMEPLIQWVPNITFLGKNWSSLFAYLFT